MPSKSTVPVQIRLPVEIAGMARLNAARRGVTLSSYLAKMVVAQVGRKR